MTTTAPAPAPTPATAPDGALDALTGAVRDAITRRIQSPRQIAVYLVGELARAGHQIGGEQQPVPPPATAPAPVADWGGWVCGRPDCALGCRPVTVPPPVPSLQAAFEARTRPADGGHLEWVGGYTDQGTPRFKYLDRPRSAYRVAFFIRTGTWPAGRVKPECGMPGCVAPVHVDDTATRERTRATYAALTGYRENGDTCRRGHSYAEHGRWRSNGKRYCHTCQQQRRSAGQTEPSTHPEQENPAA